MALLWVELRCDAITPLHPADVFLPLIDPPRHHPLLVLLGNGSTVRVDKVQFLVLVLPVSLPGILPDVLRRG